MFFSIVPFSSVCLSSHVLICFQLQYISRDPLFCFFFFSPTRKSGWLSTAAAAYSPDVWPSADDMMMMMMMGIENIASRLLSFYLLFFWTPDSTVPSLIHLILVKGE